MTIIESSTPYQLLSIAYQVPSASEPGTAYTVTLTDDGTRCTCTAGHYRRLCWHRKAVQTGQVTSKPRVRIRPLEATVVMPAQNPASFLYEA